MRNRLLNLFSRNAKRGAGIFAEGNVIYLYDFIAGSESDAAWWGGISAEGFTKQLLGMEGDVKIRIDCPGGDVFGGRAIAQAIREYPGTVTCQVDGLAASAASYIAIAGDTVVMAPGSFMMIHKAWTIALGNSDDLAAEAVVLGKIDDSIAASYAAKAGDGDADWLALMKAETWLTAQEALDYGLADEVLSETVNKASNAVGRKTWDLTAFVHPPVDEIAIADDEPEVIEPAPIAPDPEVNDVLNEIAARERGLTVALLLRAA
ncbi:Clp protease ClpP [soil metagenome]